MCKSHPYKYLSQHIQEINYIFYKLLDFYDIKINEKEKKLFEYVIKYHDIGKCREEFQEYIKNIEENKKVSSPGSHSLWSIEKIEELLKKNSFWNKDKEFVKEYDILISYLIAKHHSNLTLEFPKNIKKQLAKLILIMKNTNKVDEKTITILYDHIELYYKLYFIRNFSSMDDIIKIADLYGIFKIADVLSAKNGLNDIDKLTKRIEIKREDIKKIIKHKLDEKRWLVQNKLSEYDYLFLRAPTGWGKTTTSLFFAMNKNYRKIFITLPTITSIKKFYDSLTKIFNKDEVGMYFYFYDALLNINDEIDERINSLFYIQNLYSPINITTVDQILLSFLQAGKYFLKRLNLRKSMLIIDEVHLLTPQMIFLLKKFIQYLVPIYDIKLLLMSATFPRGLKEYLLEGLPNNNVKFGAIDIYGIWDKGYYDEYYYNRKRFELFIEDNDILENIDFIIKENKDNKSILVITNTVEKAVAIYKKLRDDYNTKNILLLHSRYMFKDREDKENKIDKIINKKGILISTQISEVSLDIDFDILFTEMAPISSLVQRFGRVNRYGLKTDAKVYVFYPLEIKEMKGDERKIYPYNIEEIKKSKEILKKLMDERNLSEGNLINIIDREYNINFYKDLINNEGIEKLYRDLFEIRNEKSTLWFFSSIYEEDGRKLLEFRDNITTLIIPYGELLFNKEKDLYNKIINNLINKYESLRNTGSYEDWVKFFAKAKLYSVPVPIWVFVNSKENDEKYGFPIIEELPEGINYKYSSEYGFINLDKLKKYGI
ncbi:CRISPR-associated nuclease/helicase Cas3 [Nanobdella aerobiophila]|uniref:CRISPR-associated nuclease/helicase Cas3 n=1 Tax=Nanobdella aerobiophila TaxID=2586965 RepID=A0A915WSA7_9ARCH|nr:CRISPR-associated helicase Cas3' [Nanobdella aerobiophila]BBL45731.1 CRISPR-associated nuclease/helicase Cas3 [Nanobdella aerobiophila]